MPAEFEAAFVEAYGALPADWRSLAASFDLINLVGLLAGGTDDPVRRADVAARIEQGL
ncbi:MAG: hypothetical protein GY898_23860 [Proteobacteria bacterium]|nr:hypothetical protein [Pseudomonadota bacterium]